MCDNVTEGVRARALMYDVTRFIYVMVQDLFNS